MHRSGKAANEPAIEVVRVVGYINVDLDTPTPVLREFIRRFCGGWLNENAKVIFCAARRPRRDSRFPWRHTREELLCIWRVY